MKSRPDRGPWVLLAALLLALVPRAGAERAVLVEPLDARVLRTFLPGLGFRVVLAVSPVDCGADASKECYRFGAVGLRSQPGETLPTVLEGGSDGSLDGDLELRIVPFEETGDSNRRGSPQAEWDGFSSAPVYVDLGQAADLDRRFRDGALLEIPAEEVRENSPLRSVPTGEGRFGRVVVVHRVPEAASPVRTVFSTVDRALAGNVPFLAGASRATPVLFLDEPAPASRESIVVEPLHANFARPGQPAPANLANVPRVRPVRVPSGECGGPEGEGAQTEGRIDCFEVAYGYVSYDSDDRPVVHVPEPDPSDPAETAITGSLDLRILPLDLDPPVAEVFTSWDGTRTRRSGLFSSAHPDRPTGDESYEVPTVRVPAEEIRQLDPEAARQGGVPAILLASHPDPARPDPGGLRMTEEAFYVPLKRDVLLRPDVADRLDTVVVPVFFELGNGGLDERKTIFLEPLNVSRLKVPGLPNFELPVVESVDHPELGRVYEFAVTYGVYADRSVRFHQVGDEDAPLEGDLAVVVAGLDDSSVTVRRTWSASDLGTARLGVDLAGGRGRSLRAARVQIRRVDVRKALPKLPGSELVVGSVRGEHVTGAQVSSGFFSTQKRVVAHRRESGNLLDVAPTPVLFQ